MHCFYVGGKDSGITVNVISQIFRQSGAVLDGELRFNGLGWKFNQFRGDEWMEVHNTVAR